MKSKTLYAFLLFVCSFFVLTSSAFAASTSTRYFNGSAGAFGGKYNRFFAEEDLTYKTLLYARLDLNVTDGNKVNFYLLQTNDWLSTAQTVSSSGTIETTKTKEHFIIYLASENMTCPSDADYCLRMPKQYSTNGSGNDIGYEFMTGFRIVNESWFYGSLNISGSYTLYYQT